MVEGQLVVVCTCLPLLQGILQTDWGQLGAGGDNRTSDRVAKKEQEGQDRPGETPPAPAPQNVSRGGGG